MDKDTPADPLAGLVEFPLPPEVSLWPQTWPSRIVIVLLIVGLIAGLWWFIRWWHANRYRRAALAELDTIVSSGPAPGSLAVLVRRTALAAFPRAEVAALSGRDWLAFLDSSYGGTGFSQGPGKVLAAAPYEPYATGADDNALADLVRRWIRKHRG
jgi:Ca-activated chloride channel family protein